MLDQRHASRLGFGRVLGEIDGFEEFYATGPAVLMIVQVEGLE